MKLPLIFSIAGVAAMASLPFSGQTPRSQVGRSSELAGRRTSSLRSTDWMCTLHKGYVLLPPVTLSDRRCELASWSPDGQKLLMISRLKTGGDPDMDEIMKALTNSLLPAASGVEMDIVDAVTGKSQVLWSNEAAGIQIQSVNWLGKTGGALVMLSGGRPQDLAVVAVMFVDVKAGRWNFIPGLEAVQHGIEIGTSPVSGIGLISVSAESAVDVTEAGTTGVNPATMTEPDAEYTVVVDRTGKIQSKLPYVSIEEVQWDETGANWYEVGRNRQKQVVVRQYVAGKSVLVTTPVKFYSEPEPKVDEVELHWAEMKTKLRAVTARARALYLSSEQPSAKPDALVAVGVDQELLSPAKNAIFYEEDGVPRLRRVLPFDESMLKSLIAAERVRLLSNAKQCGLALLMYSNDADDLLPPSSQDLSSNILPYLKNADLLDGFVYTPPGDLNLTNVANPASTILGYIDGPGGRAVIYTDGHAKWQPSP